ncbi:MAG: extracellular solute-binding protein [Planctomycetes bacterium]|nr:extracellular solute-binding protein [Planctomycetota bacterium]
MQYSPPIPHNRHRPRARAAAALLVVSALAVLVPVGCDPVLPPAAQSKPFEGQSLTLHCPDAAFADAVAPMVAAWAARTGATVRVERAPAAPDADLAIIPTGALGEWADGGHLAPVPAKLRTGEQFQWAGLLPVYGERLSTWGGQVVAVPLTGDGFVLVYDRDRFADPAARAEYQKRHNRALAAPATWDELADVAAVFADLDKRPSLPPLPADPDKLFDLFARVAAAHDRRALNDVELAARVARDPDALAFQYSVVSGKPRPQAHGFRRAAEWLDRARRASAPGTGDPAAALAAPNGAVLGLLSLDQLARLPKATGAVAARFAVAPVPGARAYFDPDRGAPVTSDQLNYVPYFSGGRLGVVRAKCAHQEAAFDLLADLGGPARGAELIGTPGLGAGPVRGSHLKSERLLLWLGYGFDGPRSQQLLAALEQYAGPTVKNPTLGPRGPDRAAVVAAVGAPLLDLAAGKVAPAAALQRAETDWAARDAQLPAAQLLRWRQRGAGLN